ncbi:hypothetical protein AJ88_04260 [Mesorhizobium amorphae CCBAU 01583]|nr:hypothetical protein AJ88_04260 [Mesorhizobium amorphae CCBAU 01583]
MRPIFKDFCGLPEGSALNDFLRKHNVVISPSFGSAAGLVFSGTPGHSVRRILAEADLADAVRDIVERPRTGNGDAAAVLAEARQHVRSLGRFSWAFERADSLLERSPGRWRYAFTSTLFAPAVLVSVLAVWMVCAWLTYVTVFDHSAGITFRNILIAGISLLLSALGILSSAVLLLGLCFLALRRIEDKDRPENSSIGISALNEIPPRRTTRRRTI